MDDRDKVIDQLHRRIDWMTQDREILLKGMEQVKTLNSRAVSAEREVARLNMRLEKAINDRNNSDIRARRFEAVLHRIAACLQSGPLWARADLEDDIGGYSEPDFEGAYDHLIALAREALEEQVWCPEHRVYHSKGMPCPTGVV